MTENDMSSNNNLKMMKIKAFILRVISEEIYTWAGKISPELQIVVNKICDEKSSALANWCIVDDHEELNGVEDNDDEDEDDDKNVSLFLLSS